MSPPPPIPAVGPPPTAPLMPRSLPQYYEMSYGLNIEMHKQVSPPGGVIQPTPPPSTKSPHGGLHPMAPKVGGGLCPVPTGVPFPALCWEENCGARWEMFPF